MSDPLSRAEAGIRARIAAHNRQRGFEAFVELASGLGLTLVTFAVVFGLAQMLGSIFGPLIGVERWIIAGGITALFAIATIVSAWRRVDPLETVAPMTQAQWRMTMISMHTPGFTYVSPRHAAAGFAALLIGGPMNVFASVSTWRDRMPGDRASITAAAALLVAVAAEDRAASSIDDAVSALLLHRLALVKVVPAGDLPIVCTTQAGRDVVGAG